MRATPLDSDSASRAPDAPASPANAALAEARVDPLDALPPAPGDEPDEARTPDEYTEPPGSHRRPSDGAALDVGG